MRVYVEADEPYRAEQYGEWEDVELAQRLFARPRRGYLMRLGQRPYETYTHIQDAWGKDRTLSRLQHRVLKWLEKRPIGSRFSQRMVADSLGVSPSSISRTLALLEAFGLAHTDRRRGRYGGTWRVAVPPESLKDRAKKAWRRIKHHQEMREWRWLKWMTKAKMPGWAIRFFARGPGRPRPAVST